MISQTGIQTINTLPDISKSKNSHLIKSGPLIEYNVRNIFLQKTDRI